MEYSEAISNIGNTPTNTATNQDTKIQTFQDQLDAFMDGNGR